MQSSCTSVCTGLHLHTLHTYIHTFYLLKNEVKVNNIYKLSTTNEQDNKAASCTYSCPLKIDDTPEQKQIYNCNKSVYITF